MFAHVVFLLFALFFYLCIRAWFDSKAPPLPPGPPGLPFIGNIRDAPAMPTWVTYQRWSGSYGSPLVRLSFFGRHIIVLNTLQAVTDLLDKRSAVYSSRPKLVMFTELCGFNWSFGTKPYGREWRHQRKLIHSQMHTQAVKRYHPAQESATHEFLRRVLDSPHEFLRHIRFLTGSQVADIAFGFKVKNHEDPYLRIAGAAMECAAAALSAGLYMVDMFPLLRHVPAWFPGARFQRQAKAWKGSVVALPEVPFAEFKRRMAHGDKPDCVATRMVESLQEYEDGEAPYTEKDIKEVIGSIYAAGSDTTVSTIQSFFLAMLLHPEVQDKAHAELDEVCPDRLPSLNNTASLPYIEAIFREALRWNPVAPEGIPHASTEDGVYEGYFIPKGSVVVANVWAILHDEKHYTNPSVFNPDRFIKDGTLDPDVLNPEVAAFGFGRRVCPGRFMAHDSVWILIASVLAMFDIRPKKDTKGEPLIPSGEYSWGSICTPKPFVCDISPRSERHAALIRAISGE